MGGSCLNGDFMSLLRDIDFIDLLLGKDYREIKGLKGEVNYISSLPTDFNDDADALKQKCHIFFTTKRRTEFSIFHDDRLYRITVIANDISGETYVIRQTPIKARSIKEIAFSTPMIQSIERKGATGLMLIAGGLGSGKTTTAAASFSHHLDVMGCLGVSIEDPIETLLEGRHGTGRCFQLEVSGDETYTSAVKKAYRMGVSAFLLSEIRDAVTANEVLRASLSMFVVSTIHASSIIDAIERYVHFCEESNPMASSTIAHTLYIIAHQKMNHNMRENKIFNRSVEIIGYNLKNCVNASAISSKIKSRQFKSLSDDLNGQIEYKF